MSAACDNCGRDLREGESAWAADWVVLRDDGPHMTTRYTCDDCHDEVTR